MTVKPKTPISWSSFSCSFENCVFISHPLTAFREAVERPFGGRRFIAHCDAARTAEGKAYLARTLHAGEDAEVFIGPEGDFSPAEIDFALAHGFEEITLGPQRLRTETAAVVATVMAAVANETN